MKYVSAPFLLLFFVAGVHSSGQSYPNGDPQQSKDLSPAVKQSAQSLQWALRQAISKVVELDPKAASLAKDLTGIPSPGGDLPSPRKALTVLDEQLVQSRGSLMSQLESAQTSATEGLQYLQMAHAPIGSCGGATLDQWNMALKGIQELSQAVGLSTGAMAAASLDEGQFQHSVQPALAYLAQNKLDQARMKLLRFQALSYNNLYQVAVFMTPKSPGSIEKSLSTLLAQAQTADQSCASKAGAIAGAAKSAWNPLSAVLPAASAQGENAPVNIAVPAPSVSGVKQDDLSHLQVAGNGTIYRMVGTGQLFSSGKNIQEAIPNAKGQMFNGQGQFVGQWQNVESNVQAEDFQVAAGPDGKNHVYTFVHAGWLGSLPIQVSKDGARIASLDNNWNNLTAGAGLVKVKIGQDGKPYADYSSDSVDIIAGIDSATQHAAVMARVPTVVIGTDKQGNPITEGIDDYQVVPNCGAYVQQIGNVIRNGNNVVAGNMANADNPFMGAGNLQAGGVTGFRIDSHCNVYAIQGGKITVNNSPVANADAGGFNMNNFGIDDHGNVYYPQNIWGSIYLKKANLLPDPGNLSAAPVSHASGGVASGQ